MHILIRVTALLAGVFGTVAHAACGYSGTNNQEGTLRHDGSGFYRCDSGNSWASVSTASGLSETLSINDLSDGIVSGTNVFAGLTTGNSTLTGAYNAGFGRTVLRKLTTGSQNTGIGNGAVADITTGHSNTGIGSYALSNIVAGTYNVGLGSLAGYYISGSVHYNTLLGAGAARGISDESAYSANTVVGYSSGYVLTTGSSNTLVGAWAGDSLTTGTKNILIGYNVDAPAATTSNHLNIGNLVYGDLSAGRVGIGTAAPVTTLDVSGVINVRDTAEAARGQLSFSPSTGFRLWTMDNGDLSLGTNGAERLTVKSTGSVGIGTRYPSTTLHVSGTGAFSGNVGIGTVAPSGKLEVRGPIVIKQNSDEWALKLSRTDDTQVAGIRYVGHPGSTGMEFWASDEPFIGITHDGDTGIGTLAPAYKLHVSGSVAGIGAYNALSDARFKTGVVSSTYGLAEVLKLDPVFYRWKHPVAHEEGRRLGLIAQEVEKLVPEAITTADDPSQTKSLGYEVLVPVLIRAVQELKAENDDLRSDLEVMKSGL